jgi:uncharacterized membrane protein SpoIIM required for sporulation
VFNVIPSSVASVGILTNNIGVAIIAYAGGISFGLITAYLLAVNGFLLGAALALTWHHGLLHELIEFVAAHGFVEISTILVAGMTGLMIGGAMLAPGDLTRRDALSVNGSAATRLLLSCVLPLFLLGFIEAYISPNEAIPAAAKITIGLSTGVLFYSYLFLAGRKKPGSLR